MTFDKHIGKNISNIRFDIFLYYLLAVKEIRSDIVIHTDASQSCGKTVVDVQKMNVDLLTGL